MNIWQNILTKKKGGGGEETLWSDIALNSTQTSPKFITVETWYNEVLGTGDFFLLLYQVFCYVITQKSIQNKVLKMIPLGLEKLVCYIRYIFISDLFLEFPVITGSWIICPSCTVSGIVMYWALTPNKTSLDKCSCSILNDWQMYWLASISFIMR